MRFDRIARPDDIGKPGRRASDWLLIVGLAVAAIAAAIAISGWSPWRAPPALTVTRLPTAKRVPIVTPVATLDVAPDDARRLNAMTPLAVVANPPARPFHFAGSIADEAGAEACLAAAAYYEAGNDPIGQAAVAQVVLNRVRHPAFPHSVCGVVSQGAERVTGCQFSFMCDGSIDRRSPSPAALTLARATARWALHGNVFGMVGKATHYHADYVIPRWSSAMDKLLTLHTHLFFRWRGPAGDADNFGARYMGHEIPGPLLSRFATIAPTEATNIDAAGPTVTAAPAAAAKTIASGDVVRTDDWRNIYYVYFAPADYAGSYAIKAWKVCADRKTCTVYGWNAAEQIPIVVTEARPPNLVFVYMKRPGLPDSTQWDCRRIPRDSARQCLADTAPAAVSRRADVGSAPAAPARTGAAPLQNP